MNVLYILPGPELWRHFVIVFSKDEEWRLWTYRSRVLSCFVRTRLSTQSSSGLLDLLSSALQPGKAVVWISGLSRANTGDIVLNGFWFRKKTVQSSSCASAPSGSIDDASKLVKRINPAHIDSCKAVIYLSSTPRGWGNWYLSWGPSNIWNSARRTKEQWLPEPAMGRSRSEQSSSGELSLQVVRLCQKFPLMVVTWHHSKQGFHCVYGTASTFMSWVDYTFT